MKKKICELTDKEIVTMQKMYGDGKKRNAICTRLNCTPGLVSKVVVKFANRIPL